MPEEFSFVFCFPASILCVAAVGLNQWSPWDGDGNGKAKSLFMDIRLSLTFASVGSICIYTGQTKYLSQTAKKKKVENKPGSLGWVQIPRDPMASPVCFYFTLMARAWSGLGFEPR